MLWVLKEMLPMSTHKIGFLQGIMSFLAFFPSTLLGWLTFCVVYPPHPRHRPSLSLSRSQRGSVYPQSRSSDDDHALILTTSLWVMSLPRTQVLQHFLEPPVLLCGVGYFLSLFSSQVIAVSRPVLLSL